jgi:MFS family permease
MTDVPAPATGSAVTPPPIRWRRWRRWRARRNGLGRDYWRLWSASTISNLGDGTSTIAYPWLATVLTRDPALIAGVAVATRLPWLLFSLHAGVVVDRSDRRRLMWSMNVARAVITAAVVALILTGAMTIPALYAAALLLGCAEVLYDNAAQTIMPRLVPADRLERANGNLWGAETVTNQFIGPPLGGALLAVGLAVPFVLDTVSFAAAALLVFLIRGSFRASPAAGTGDEAAPRPSMRAAIGEGLRWLWAHRLLRALAIVLGVMNLATALAFATFVLFAQEVLELGAAGFGVLSTAMAVGAVLGSVLAANVSRWIGPGAALLMTLVVGVVVPLVVGLTSSALLVGAVSVAFGFTMVLWNVITVSLRQSIIPDHLLGRVNSVYRFLGWGGMPIGAFVGGVLVSLVEPAAGRELALRSPWFACAGLHLVVLVSVGSRLSTTRIEAAKASAAVG